MGVSGVILVGVPIKIPLQVLGGTPKEVFEPIPEGAPEGIQKRLLKLGGIQEAAPGRIPEGVRVCLDLEEFQDEIF